MIKLTNITKEYETNKNYKVTALNNVTLTIKQGEVVVLKGASGSGKSTILSLIAGLAKPTSGEIVIDEKRISKLPEKFSALFRREHIGFIFQKYNLIPNISVFENVLLPLIPANPDSKTIEDTIDKILDDFNILDKKHSIVKNLSGGEQQRVAIARSIVNTPNIVIADEPTANLDKKLSIDFIDSIKKLKNQNKTIIIATHDQIFDSLDFVDRVINIENGVLCS